MIRDEALPLPAPTAPPPALRGPGDTLVHAAAARRRPFVLATARVRVTGSETGGAASAVADGWPLLDGLGVEGATAAAVRLAPAEARRELAGAAGGLLETLLAAERVAGLVAEWRTDGPATPTPLTLRWRVPVRGSVGAWADDDPEAWRCEGPLLGVHRRLAPRAPGHVLFQLTPAPEWEVVPVEGALEVRARLPLDAGGHATLLAVAAHHPEDAAAALAALAPVRAVEARAEGAAVELRRERLSLTTGVRDLDDALAWASARVRAAWGAEGFHGSDEAPPAAAPFADDAEADAAWTGLGALAAGDHALARLAAGGPLDHPLRAVLLGRLVAWSGEPERLEERRDDALRAAEGLDPAVLDPARAVAWRAALDGWLEAAECLGDPPWAAALRERRDALAAARPRAAGVVRLPMAGGAGGHPDPGASFAAALLGGPEATAWAPPAGPPVTAVERGLRAWAAFATGRADEGSRLLREHLAAGFEDVAGAWRAAPGHAARDHAASAALAPAATLYGMLGGRAEAWYGRLRLAPRLPSHWTRLTVRCVRVGGARVELSYARGGDGHTFGIRQVGGRVPLTLVFEPEVPSGGPTRVFVDGAPADVGTEPVGDRVRVGLQLPLDREREVRVEPDDAGADGEAAGA